MSVAVGYERKIVNKHSTLWECNSLPWSMGKARESTCFLRKNCVRRQVVLSRTLLADSSALSSRAAMARVRLVLTSRVFSWNTGGAKLPVGVVWGFLVQLQFKWPLFTELVGFSFTEDTCCSKLIHATILRSLPLPAVFQAIDISKN